MPNNKTGEPTLPNLKVWPPLMIFLIIMLIPSLASADEPSFDDINNIADGLNCPTCRGISLKDCGTTTCEQWKEQIGELLAEGYTDQEVLDEFAVRYGQQVLQEPPASGGTMMLWVLPIIAVLLGGGWVFYLLQKWQKPELASVSTAQPISGNDYLNKVEQDLERL